MAGLTHDISMVKTIPAALTIAGSDSGGGAGIQADLKTFAALGVHGASVITALTAQNPRRVLKIQPCSLKMLRGQLDAVFQEIPPAAIKTGMLFSAANVKVVADFLKRNPRHSPLVVDPVMISTSGVELLQRGGLKVLKEKLLPLATLVTPNLSEAEILADCKIRSVEDMRDAALKIHLLYGCAALIKGGHLRGSNSATDIFFDGKTELVLRAAFAKGIATHGTGCVYSAAICAALASGESLRHAAQTGKRFVTRAIFGSYKIGRAFALGVGSA